MARLYKKAPRWYPPRSGLSYNLLNKAATL